MLFFSSTVISPQVLLPRVFVGILWPGIVAIFAGKWNGMEHPYQLSGHHAVGLDMPRRGKIVFAW